MKIGGRLHALRQEAHLTLSELSRASGVALATLSRIENDRMIGTLRSHIAICKALGTDLSELYGDLLPSPSTIDATLNAAPEVVTQTRSVVSELLVPRLSGKKMVPVLIKIAPGASTSQERGKRGVEKFIFMAEGAIDAKIDGQSYLLKRGDSLYFDSSLPHTFQLS